MGESQELYAERQAFMVLVSWMIFLYNDALKHGMRRGGGCEIPCRLAVLVFSVGNHWILGNYAWPFRRNGGWYFMIGK